MEIIIIILQILIGLGLLYTNSYAKKKGENKADKEDIASLTQKIEEVKSSFTQQNEKLKSKLSLLTNIQSGIVQEQRHAIIDYNEKYFRWFHAVLDSRIGNIDELVEIDVYKSKLEEYYMECDFSSTRFRLFIENEFLVEFADALRYMTYQKFAMLPLIYLSKLQALRNSKDFTNPVKLESERDRLKKEYYHEKPALYEHFYNSWKEEFPSIASKIKEFQKMSQQHIYHIINKELE